VIRVHVLHVDGQVAQTPHTHIGAQNDRLVWDAVLACKGAVGGVDVTEQQRLSIQSGQQVTVELRGRERNPTGDGINGAPVAVARNQDAVQFAGNAPFGSATASAVR